MLTLLHFKLWLKENHQLVGLIVYSVWEYWLGKTEKFAASSSIELVGWVVKRLLIQRGKDLCKK